MRNRCVVIAYKKILFLFLFGSLFSCVSVAQNRLIPAKVKSAFSAMYPSAISESWEMYTRDFIASFTLQGKLVKATFTDNGEWIQSAVKLSIEQVPAAINTNFQKSPYKEYKILHVNMVSSVKELLLYEMEVEGNFKEHVRLIFNNVGEMITVKRSW